MKNNILLDLKNFVKEYEKDKNNDSRISNQVEKMCSEFTPTVYDIKFRFTITKLNSDNTDASVYIVGFPGYNEMNFGYSEVDAIENAIDTLSAITINGLDLAYENNVKFEQKQLDDFTINNAESSYEFDTNSDTIYRNYFYKKFGSMHHEIILNNKVDEYFIKFCNPTNRFCVESLIFEFLNIDNNIVEYILEYNDDDKKIKFYRYLKLYDIISKFYSKYKDLYLSEVMNEIIEMI